MLSQIFSNKSRKPNAGSEQIKIKESIQIELNENGQFQVCSTTTPQQCYGQKEMKSEEFAAYQMKESRKAVRSFYNDIKSTEVKKQPVPLEVNAAIKKNTVYEKLHYAK